MSDMQEIVRDVWDGKYRYWLEDGTSPENSREDSLKRVVKAVYAKDQSGVALEEAMRATLSLEWCPAGRVHAGAGTDKRVTLMNCFVSPTIEDSLRSENGIGIMDALTIASLTQQMGGGIGMDFSTIRPDGALVKRTGSMSSGILPFADMWHAMCATIMSSGSRRGAMMLTLRCDHPDLWNEEHYEVRSDGKLKRPSFITAKLQPGRMTNFNVSVLVTDEFMEAVEQDAWWDLGFDVPRADGKHVDVCTRNGKPWYVYRRVPATTIWQDIIKNTYEHAEPGIIFIDVVNRMNNLRYCETISCTNPCGEQPLPPDGDCNLGAINLAKLVLNPFTSNAAIDMSRLREVAAIGTRFLDNVLDVSMFPTEQQLAESKAKRRIGLGVTGLGNMLQMLRLRYGSQKSCELVSRVMYEIADAAYYTSAMLAVERGTFPMYDAEEFAKSHYLKQLSKKTRRAVAKFGIRNGVLLTVAPTGTTSIYYDNVSSGIEPTFSWSYNRDVLQPDGTRKEYEVRDYGYDLYRSVVDPDGKLEMPYYMVTALELSVDEHLAVQAAVQQYVDASVSKTINCPADMPFEDFQSVYETAYASGLKGCTTYRPNLDSGRGSVLRVVEKKQTTVTSPEKLPRQEVMAGKTYKMPWPVINTSFYITINNIELDGQVRPFEIFINSKSAIHDEWAKALTRLISAVFRRGGGDVTFLVEELEAIHSADAGSWIEGKYVPSVPALIGHTLRKHFVDLGLMGEGVRVKTTVEGADEVSIDITWSSLGVCPRCSAKALIRQEGCDRCTSCGHSSCG